MRRAVSILALTAATIPAKSTAPAEIRFSPDCDLEGRTVWSAAWAPRRTGS